MVAAREQQARHANAARVLALVKRNRGIAKQQVAGGTRKFKFAGAFRTVQQDGVRERRQQAQKARPIGLVPRINHLIRILQNIIDILD
jgi:hypothetical protein